MTKGKIPKKDPSPGIDKHPQQPRCKKIQTEQIREEIYYSPVNCGLFSEKQKRFHKGTRGISDLLYIDQHILKESKARWKNVAMT